VFVWLGNTVEVYVPVCVTVGDPLKGVFVSVTVNVPVYVYVGETVWVRVKVEEGTSAVFE
jgi:hypothetical protein